LKGYKEVGDVLALSQGSNQNGVMRLKEDARNEGDWTEERRVRLIGQV